MYSSSIPTELTAASNTAGRNLVLANAFRKVLWIALCCAIAAQFVLIFIRPINWDEFYFLSRIYEYRRGALSDTLQTFHVHFFFWLTALPLDEIGQIFVARFVMLALEAFTLAMIFRVARFFASPQAALFATAAYALTSTTMLHGASFRFDPIATFLLMSSLGILTIKRLRGIHIAGAGLLVAAAGVVTIKSVFYLPAVASVTATRLSNDRNRMWRALFSGGAAVFVSFVGLHLVHKALLAKPHFSSAEAFLSHSVSTMLGPGMFLHNLPYLQETLFRNPAQWLAIGTGLAICTARLIRNPSRVEKWALMGLTFPLAATLFYRNAYPYFYVFALAPASVVIAVAADATKWEAGRMIRITALMGLTGLLNLVGASSQNQQSQRTVLRAIHQIFPLPVTYIDKCSMVASFPKVGFFMSSWLTEKYYDTHSPSFPDILRTQHPIFVLANSNSLESALQGNHPSSPGDLLPRDATALHENFIHHWGPIWIAGKALDADGQTTLFEIATPARYTVETFSPILIDGRAAKPGAVLHLDQGKHTVRTSGGKLHVVLRWGDHLTVPSESSPKGAIFNGF